jgi:hypothetical protein
MPETNGVLPIALLMLKDVTFTFLAMLLIGRGLLRK